MSKKTMLAIAVSAFATLAIPATASAVWQEHGVNLAQNAQIQFTGQFHLAGEWGTVRCQTDGAMTLIAGQTTASVTSFGVDLTKANSTVTQECEIDENLGAFGCTDVASMTVEGLPWTAHAVNTQTIAITSGTIQIHLHSHGVFCPKTIQLTPGTWNLNMSTAQTWTTAQLSGTVQTHLSFGSQNSTATGHQFITPSGRYGVA